MVSVVERPPRLFQSGKPFLFASVFLLQRHLVSEVILEGSAGAGGFSFEEERFSRRRCRDGFAALRRGRIPLIPCSAAQPPAPSGYPVTAGTQ